VTRCVIKKSDDAPLDSLAPRNCLQPAPKGKVMALVSPIAAIGPNSDSAQLVALEQELATDEAQLSSEQAATGKNTATVAALDTDAAQIAGLESEIAQLTAHAATTPAPAAAVTNAPHVTATISAASVAKPSAARVAATAAAAVAATAVRAAATAAKVAATAAAKADATEAATAAATAVETAPHSATLGHTLDVTA